MTPFGRLIIDDTACITSNCTEDKDCHCSMYLTHLPCSVRSLVSLCCSCSPPFPPPLSLFGCSCSSPLSLPSLFFVVLVFVIHSSYVVEASHFRTFFANPLQFDFFWKYYFLLKKLKYSKIPVVRKSIRFPCKTMILPMSHERPDDKFGSSWSQHCLDFSTFWREAMKNLEAAHLSIV